MTIFIIFQIIFSIPIFIHMKKSSNFKQLFQKIHKDNLFRSPYRNLESDININSYKSISSNINLIQSKQKQKQKKFDRIKQNQRPKSARPPSSRVAIPLSKQKTSESVKQFLEIVEVIEKQILLYFKNKSSLQITNTKYQLGIILKLCESLDENSQEILKKFQSFFLDLSKLLDYRITRIVFYFIYTKFLQCSPTQKSNKQLKLLELCNQYSRSLNILTFALYSCTRVQKILMEEKNFQESKEYAKKALNLAIYLKNGAEQFKAIEALKMLSYYNGAMYSSKQSYLSPDERQRIQRNFNPKKYFVLKTESESGTDQQITLDMERMDAQEEDERISKNVQEFISNLAFINKNLTDRSKNIMRTIKKVNKFGFVNKYLEKGGHITLQPQSRNLPNKNREQVFLTRPGKNTHLQTINKFYKFYLPKFIEMIHSLIKNM